MSKSIASIIPPDDSGSDSFSRFHYQAQIALPFCLFCITNPSIKSIIMEHFEDIIIEGENDWRFIQVKTKNPELGTWKLTEVIGKSGGLRSLYRTYSVIKKLSIDYSLELLLEGALDKKDDISNLKNNIINYNIIKKVCSAFNTEAKEANEFLSKIIILPSPPNRQSINASNRDLIHSLNGSLNRSSIIKLETKLIDSIETRMRAEQIKREEWPDYLNSKNAYKNNKFDFKRLTKDSLIQLTENLLVKSSFLLERVMNTASNSSGSNLERKLINGGATQEIIENASLLKANMQKYLIEKKIQNPAHKDQFVSDLKIRLKIQADSRLSKYKDIADPAIQIWNDLLDDFNKSSQSIDKNNVLESDPLLLLGAICDYADECFINFGGSYEA